MDDDLQCKPKRTLGRRDLFGLPQGLEVDRAFAPSVNVPIPCKDSIAEEPWKDPAFQKPDHRAESQAKGLFQNELARELAQTSSDKNQVLLTGTHNTTKVIAESLPEHISQAVDELPKVLQRKMRR